MPVIRVAERTGFDAEPVAVPERVHSPERVLVVPDVADIP